MNNLICKIMHGSHLYGTNTPNSDTDYKSIYLPFFEDVLLCDVKHTIYQSTGSLDSKNTKDDVDDSAFSLHKFIHMLLVGDIMAFDILYAPDSMIVEKGRYFWIFEELRKHHALFSSKNIAGYIGYIRKQTAKYSSKGSKLAIIREILENLDLRIKLMGEESFKKLRIEDVIEQLPITEYSNKTEKGYMIIGKMFQYRDYVYNLQSVLKKYFDEYGARALQAEQNKGIDFKAVSHAARACYQLIDLYKHDKMILPLPSAERDVVLMIKQGQLNYKNEVEPLLEKLHLTVEELAKTSKFPDVVNEKEVNTFLLKTLKRAYLLI